MSFGESSSRGMCQPIHVNFIIYPKECRVMETCSACISTACMYKQISIAGASVTRKRHIHRKNYSPKAFYCKLTEKARPFANKKYF